MNWYVIYTKPKWEKRIAEQLNKFGLNCYCPTIIKTHQWADRKKKVEVPLFNNYIFVQLEEKDRNKVFISPGVIRYLFWLGKHAIVKDKEINTIKEWLNADETSDISVVEYQIGQKIKLNSGPFSEQYGVVKDVTKNYYVLILESLGCILKVNH
ncbi:UpxY family transcription antiterminator [Flavobacterium cellulosilyticum]|uniref:UpxY family transcription antiterminator n=1 Tax=Flavobacterium cellulosilyticum TaxID=2541731 RepID=A0A4R5CA48_9FLAO|nr:UpxY family transcription antiterminator [Flavobacterium cellulosilyticum]TDD95060.1 UpxY family transcription antiterminator [Flavobacterium cellulosilyticum]